MNQEKHLVLILERSSANLDIRKDGQDVILEGIFAQFGVVNNNDRIYEENEYLPHLEYLQKKIGEKRLLGELDHPEKFDVSLTKVSHVIEKLDYDKNKRQIVGRVRLLDTPSGRIAKELVESGVPISISSRAAGLVESTKRVKIKKIFTYDLVADPGFENAILSRMNESLGIINENIAIYDAKTYESSYPDLMETETEKETKTSKSMDYVTSEELNTYSLVLKEEIEEIHKKLGMVSQDSELSEKIQQMGESVDKMQKYVNYLANTVDNSIKYGEYVAEKLDQVIDYTDYMAKVLDESIEFSNQVSEKSEKSIAYSEYLKEQIEKGIEYSEYLKECIETGVSYSEYIGEKLDKTIQYSEYVAENANKGILYTEYVAEEANQLSEKLTEAIAYADYLGESLNNGISYTEYVGEQTQSLADYTEFMLNEKKGETPVNENEKPSDYSSLTEKIDSLLGSIKESESTKKQKVEEAINNMDEARKQKVSNALNESSQHTADRFINNLLSSGQEEELNEKWLSEAPEDYKAIWESLEQGVKNTIVAQSKFYKLESPYQIKNFWETRKLNNTAKVINENVEGEKPSSLGYTNSYLKAIEKNLERFSKNK